MRLSNTIPLNPPPICQATGRKWARACKGKFPYDHKRPALVAVVPNSAGAHGGMTGNYPKDARSENFLSSIREGELLYWNLRGQVSRHQRAMAVGMNT